MLTLFTKGILENDFKNEIKSHYVSHQKSDYGVIRDRNFFVFVFVFVKMF